MSDDRRDVLVEAHGLSKKYARNLKRSLRYGLQDIAAELLLRPARGSLRPDEFWAIRDLNFQIRRGESIGIIGRNGAGKSTLLKILDGLIKPDAGHVVVTGRVAGLIELGAGFNPVLTGRENIYVNAAILGFAKKETDRRLEDIIEFSGLEDFMDAPVQSYSSGMRVRLGFAIAAQLEPDVLLIDEVLAVGDAGFRARCYEAIDRMRRHSAIVFVSHNMEAVTRVTDRALVLRDGGVVFDGDPVGAAACYSEAFEQESSIVTKEGYAFHSLRINDGENVIDFDQSLRALLEVESPAAHEDLLLKVNLSTATGELVAEYSSRNNAQTIRLEPGRTRIEIEIHALHLLPQKYYLSFTIIRGVSDHLLWCRNVATIRVRGGQQGHQPNQLVGVARSSPAGEE